MSKNKPNSALTALTNPAVLASAVYFEVELASKDQYFDFVKSVKKNMNRVRQCLIDTKTVPKFFDIVGTDYVYDLKALLGQINVESTDTTWTVLNQKVPENLLEQNEKLLTMNYAEFLCKKLQYSGLSAKLSADKKANLLPTVMSVSNTPRIIGKNFVMTIDQPNDFKLAEYDYVFPQKCVFALHFLLLGNRGPIEKFYEKISEGLDLGQPFESGLQNILNNDSIEVYDFDLLENAADYDLELKNILFRQQIEQAVEAGTDAMIAYEDLPVVVTFNDRQELNIRIPFLTFDMYCESVLDDTDEADVAYSAYTMKRIILTELLDELGLDYCYVVGQRPDFVHEPEMRRHVVSKIKSRDVIPGNVYFEQSNHHVMPKENEAVSANMLMVQNFDYPIVVLTLQSENEIVKQVNAYMLDPSDDVEQIQQYFENLGAGLDHFVVNDTAEMVYCPEHLKVSALFF